ncbi:MAG: flagellar filament capping protein FliD [Chloroflexi bacterium]|nr:flagellar filament capping protein FliD [Chloroflexota bacterium]
MADPVRVSGFFSTFDTEAVIKQLTEVRQIRIRRMDIEQARADVRGQTIADLNTRLAALLSKAKALSSITSVSGKSTTVEGSGVAAAAGPSAATGTFTVDVTKLATGTTATGSAITAALDSTSPMSRSNFATGVTDGKFTIKTATGGSAQFTVGPTAANSAALLNASNFSTAVTSGTFTLATTGGGSAVINVDITTQSLDDVITAINGSGIGVTASLTNDANGRATILTLTSTNGDITVGGGSDTSNFLTATNLSAATGTTTRASTAAFTTQDSLAQVITAINASGIGVTATITNDANGRANIVSLASASGAITLGTGADTSNFLSATNLLASPGTTSRQSTQAIARMNGSTKMADGSWFGGAPASGAHTFTVNGVSIAYDTAADSLNDVIARINGSTAGVTARYDTATDTIKLQQSKTGSLAVTLADDGSGGNFLSKTGLLTATQALGASAEYSIDGGATQYASSNSVLAVAGVTLTFSTLTTVGTPVKVTVNQDTSSAVTAIKAFVTEFNAAITAIDEATKTDAKDASSAGALSGDASVRALKSSLRGLINGPGLGLTGKYTNLGEVGLSFGAVGSAVGTTNTLQFDESKFKAALAADPTSVQSLLSAYTLSATLAGGGTGSLASMTGSYTGTKTGSYAITDDGSGHLSAVFSPADGGSQTTTTATVTAGGSNTTLIPGMTLTIGALQAGNHSIAVSATKSSVFRQVQQYLEGQAGAGGILTKRQDTYSAVSKDIAARKVVIQDRIDKEMAILRRKFVAMEQAQARAQSAMTALQQAMVKVSNQ